MTIYHATTVTGTLTFQSEKDGREITRRFPAFQAHTGWAYIDIVDHAIELVSLPNIGDYGWMQIDENINEALNRGGRKHNDNDSAEFELSDRVRSNDPPSHLIGTGIWKWEN